MAKLIISIVVYLAALFLTCWAYFIDKNGNKGIKGIIVCIVFISAIGGVWLEISKYYDIRNQDEQISKIVSSNSLLNKKYDNLNMNYESLKNIYDSLGVNYKRINDALKRSKLSYDPATKAII